MYYSIRVETLMSLLPVVSNKWLYLLENACTTNVLFHKDINIKFKQCLLLYIMLITMLIN